MTDRDQIIAWAREAGFTVGSGSPALEKLESLVRIAQAHEREQCARVCDAEAANWVQNSDGQVSLQGVAAAIRGRAEK